MNQDILKILVSEEEIEEATKRIASEIDRDFRDTDGKLLLLCILKGSVVFMGELMKKITLPVEIDFMKVSSYGAGTKTSGRINIILDLLRSDFEDLNIIVVEDIIDSGKTLSYLTEYLKLKGARSVKTCTLLDKPSRRLVDFNADMSLFTIPDYFVIGYGLDCAEQYRGLPYIAEYSEE